MDRHSESRTSIQSPASRYLHALPTSSYLSTLRPLWTLPKDGSGAVVHAWAMAGDRAEGGNGMSQQIGLDFIGPITFNTRALIVAPSKHAQAKETSALAAVANHPHRVNQNTRLIALLEKAGAKGLADPVICRITGWPRSTVCARRADVGVMPAKTRYKHRNGRTYCRWRLASDEERKALEQPAAADLLRERIQDIEAGR